MKKIVTLLLALVATTALWAHDFEVNGIYYNILTDKTNEVEVTSGSKKYSGSVTIPATVTYNGTTYSVTSIGDQAFEGCEGLTSVTIPNSVTSIGYAAFSGCSSLTSITIPNSVTSIGDGAFGGCSGLTSIVVEESNTTYDSRENCNAIIETTSNTLVSGCQHTIIPNSVTSIGNQAFYYCKSLTSITIPNSVTSIGDYAFDGCSGLTSITIPNSVTSIGYGAFWSCSGLTSITIGNSVTKIGDYAFDGCSGLTSITIPNSVTSIGDGAFWGCSRLTSVTIPNSVTSIGEGAFYECSGLTSVTIGNSVTSIGDYAFCECESLREVICYAEKVPQMGEGVFYYTPQSEATLYVLADALEDYKIAEQWKEFGTILPIQEPSTDLENTHSLSPMANRQKVIRDGQLIILRDGVEYNAQGQIIKE